MSSLFLLASLTIAPARADFNRLHPRAADASSYLRSNWNRFTENYHPNYVLDDNPATAWVEGAEGNGEGAVLRLPVSTLQTARSVKLRVRNGYQKSSGLLTANAAPRDVEWILYNALGEVVVRKAAALERKEGWQEIQIDLPAGAGLARVELRIDSVHEGSKYKDTCISDVQILVDSEVTYNPGQEKRNQTELDQWIRERVEAAKYFASQPPEFPFAGTQAETQSTEVDTAAMQAALSNLPARLEALSSQEGWWKRTSKERFRGLPDGLPYDMEAWADYLVVGNVATFETQDSIESRSSTSDDEYWTEEHTISNLRITKHASTGLAEQVWFWTNHYEEGRNAWTNRVEYLLVFDSAGRLSTVYTENESDDEMGGSTGQEVWHYHRDASHKIERVELWRSLKLTDPEVSQEYDRTPEGSHSHHTWVLKG